MIQPKTDVSKKYGRRPVKIQDGGWRSRLLCRGLGGGGETTHPLKVQILNCRFRMTTERLLNMPPNEHVVKVKAVWEVSLAFLKFILLFFPCRKDKLLLLAYLLMGST